MPSVARRFFLSAAPAAAFCAVSATPARVFAAKQRSYVATHGAAPFASDHLLPGDELDLSRVDLTHPAARVVALTIDDGPDPLERRMLDALRADDARATFFYIGGKVAGGAAVARDVAAAGHEIGCHSFSHPMMSDLPADARRRELAETVAALARVGVRPGWFRPPFGDFDAAVVAAARAAGMRTILWTVDSKDWKGLDADAAAARCIDRLKPGAVILTHGTKPATAAALPRILAAGRERGLRFVGLTEWRDAMRRAAGGR